MALTRAEVTVLTFRMGHFSPTKTGKLWAPLRPGELKRVEGKEGSGLRAPGPRGGARRRVHGPTQQA